MKKAPFVLAPAALVTLALIFPMNFMPQPQIDLRSQSFPQTQTNSQGPTDPPLQTKARQDSRLPARDQEVSQQPTKIIQSSAGTKTAPVPVAADRNKGVSFLKPPFGHGKEIVGYYAEDWPGDKASLSSVKTFGRKLSGIASFSFRLNRSGTLAGTSPSAAVKASHNNGSKALALVHNYNNGKFDGDLVHTIIADPALRNKTAANILTVIRNGQFDGVNIDLENLRSADQVLFTRFIKELANLLHAKGYMVTISVPAKTGDFSGGWGGAFDYEELGKAVDRVMLMTYDEHWFGGTPGPVASVGWVEQVVRYAKSRIPAHKVLLGLGVYGYEWDTNSGTSTRALPAAKALQVAYQYGADIQWDKTSQAPYFYYWPYGRKHVVWFESNNSAAFKMDLVNKYGLAGVAIWRLGFEDAGFWQLVSKKFGAVN